MAEMKNPKMKEQDNVELVRILGKDLRGDLKLIVGMTKIKGISWSYANALCKIISLDTEKRIGDLNSDEIKKIETSIKEVSVPIFLKNRQKDFDTGEDQHLLGPDLNLRNEFDVKRLRKIKSYRGIRHASRLPVRGQRTKGNFRHNRKKSGAVGVKKKK
jgi:small subunit ribosomal protein S13